MGASQARTWGTSDWVRWAADEQDRREQQEEARWYKSERERPGHDPQQEQAQPVEELHKRAVVDWAQESARLEHLSQHELLGVGEAELPQLLENPKRLGNAFRAQAMIWHPDHHMQKSNEQQLYSTARFKRLMGAYSALRKEARSRNRDTRRRGKGAA